MLVPLGAAAGDLGKGKETMENHSEWHRQSWGIARDYCGENRT